jgi:hypothetical protein
MGSLGRVIGEEPQSLDARQSLPVGGRDPDPVLVPPFHVGKLRAKEGRLETVQLLLARGAKPSARNADGDTAQSAAERSGYPAIAALMRSR